MQMHTACDDRICKNCTLVKTCGTIMWSCKACNWDVCLDCARRVCPMRHILSEFAATTDEHFCNECLKTVPVGSSAWCCRSCDWDVCEKCLYWEQDQNSSTTRGISEVQTCPWQHQLTTFTLTRSSKCAHCTVDLPPGGTLRGCPICYIHLCKMCQHAGREALGGSLSENGTPTDHRICASVQIREHTAEFGIEFRNSEAGKQLRITKKVMDKDARKGVLVVTLRSDGRYDTYKIFQTSHCLAVYRLRESNKLKKFLCGLERGTLVMLAVTKDACYGGRLCRGAVDAIRSCGAMHINDLVANKANSNGDVFAYAFIGIKFGDRLAEETVRRSSDGTTTSLPRVTADWRPSSGLN